MHRHGSPANHASSASQGSSPSARRSDSGSALDVAFVVFLAAAATLLILEHRAHLLGAWPLLFLVACLGAHLLMHRGHGGGGHDGH